MFCVATLLAPFPLLKLRGPRDLIDSGASVRSCVCAFVRACLCMCLCEYPWWKNKKIRNCRLPKTATGSCVVQDQAPQQWWSIRSVLQNDRWCNSGTSTMLAHCRAILAFQGPRCACVRACVRVCVCVCVCACYPAFQA